MSLCILLLLVLQPLGDAAMASEACRDTDATVARRRLPNCQTRVDTADVRVGTRHDVPECLGIMEIGKAISWITGNDGFGFYHDGTCRFRLQTARLAGVT